MAKQMIVEGVLLRRGVKPDSWYARIGHHRVEFTPFLGWHSRRPNSWNCLTMHDKKLLGHQSNTLKLMVKRAKEAASLGACAECGRYLYYEAGEAGNTAGGPDSWEAPTASTIYCDWCGWEETDEDRIAAVEEALFANQAAESAG